MEEAKTQKKPVIVDFYADWCKWCKVMDEKTFSDPGIKKIFDTDWVTIRIDTQDITTKGTYQGKTMTYRELSTYFGVEGLPSFLFIDKNGEKVNIEVGYIPADQFSKFLDYYKKELYKKNIKIDDYVNKK
jgi:thioredoxin-related protein